MKRIHLKLTSAAKDIVETGQQEQRDFHIGKSTLLDEDDLKGTKVMDKTKNKGANLAEDHISGLLFKLAMPAILAQLINVLYNIVDRVYIGHIKDVGAAALTGVGVTMPLILCISAFAALVSMGGAPHASIMMGKGDKETAEKIMGNCFAMLIIAAVVITTIVQIFGKDILMLFGASSATIGFAWDYLKIYSMGTMAVQLALGLNAFINAQGFAKTGMMTVLIGAICNIILDPIMIFGFGMGVKGAALATIISQTVSCVWIITFLLGEKTTLRLRWKNFILSGKIILPCLALGLAPFIMQFSESILNISFNTSLQKYGGDVAVGAMTILTSIMQFMVLPLQGLTQGAQPIISYNYGADNSSRIKETFKLLLKCCLCYATVMWLLCMLAPRLFVGAFTNDLELITYTKWALRIYLGAGCLLGAQIACQQTFIALSNAKTSVFLALLRKMILLIPLIFILPLFIPNKTFAVYLAEPVSDVIAVCTTCILFYRQYKKL